MIHIKVNGDEQRHDTGITIKELIVQLGIKSEGVAVAVNEEVVTRREHHTYQLNDGDTVEIVRAIGGGSR